MGTLSVNPHPFRGFGAKHGLVGALQANGKPIELPSGVRVTSAIKPIPGSPNAIDIRVLRRNRWTRVGGLALWPYVSAPLTNTQQVPGLSSPLSSRAR